MVSPHPRVLVLLRKHILTAFCTLITSSALLASRYDGSGAFERPVHFCILTLLLTGIALYLWAKCSNSSVSPHDAHSASDDAQKCTPAEARREGSQLKSSVVLLLLVLARTALFWRTIRAAHCSWNGLETFLPFILIAFDLTGELPELLAHRQDGLAHLFHIAPGHPLIAVIALAWGISAIELYAHTAESSGAICPCRSWEHLIPLAQLAVALLDAQILRSVSRVNDAHGRSTSWRIVALVCLLSAGLVLLVAALTCIDRPTYRWTVYLSAASVADLVLDSVIATCGLIAGVYLLGLFLPFTVAITVVMTNVLVHLQRRTLDGALARVFSTVGGAHIGFTVFLCGGALLQCARNMSGKVEKRAIFKGAVGGLLLLLGMVVLAQTRLMNSSYSQRDRIATLVASAKDASDRWIAAARQSTSLDDAVHEYQSRYGIPPPPHFDKWYEYAESVRAPVIDDYGQIHRDLLPFWGTPPVMLRERTAHLLEHPSLSIGGLIIRDGQVDVSPHIHGTHRWMMDTMKSMIEPFAQWVPDMQLAFNLDDECRVSVPFKRMQNYTAEAHRSRSRLVERDKIHADFSTAQNPPWATAYLGQARGEELFNADSPWFAELSKNPIFDEWIASACDPAAPVNRRRWWNMGAACAGCAAPHMVDGVVSNWTLAGNLCHQPDMAHLHGFLSSPSTFKTSHVLLPIFSQSRVHGFADIVYPSPWNFRDMVPYDTSKEVPWQDKDNSLYWRGASSDGFAAHGAWQTFLRARFVNRAAHFHGGKLRASRHQTDNVSPSNVNVNASFVGDFGRCDPDDCAAEHAHFYGGPDAPAPASLDFQEHWRHRHLVDLDGAGFSGRFLPFLQSASLPYRAALFRTWWEERVHPWRHFVPVDLRLNDLWGLVRFFGSRRGEAQASEIAREGADWARRALRKEDMQVYMFRLLLEWGRLVDDRREEIGFAIK